MADRPDFLAQPAKLKKRDRELQEQLKAEAAARGVVPTKDSRRQDFINRSIAEIEKHLRKKNISDRQQLKDRLTFLREELARLTT